jgi:hypothetical protein
VAEKTHALITQMNADGRLKYPEGAADILPGKSAASA